MGDVHGCFNEFLDLLKAAGYNRKTHRLILLGDIINRGPHSFEMLEWVKARKVEMIQGNHEEAFVRFVRGKKRLPPVFSELKQKMGGKLEGWLKWMENLPLYIKEKGFIAVHAGLVPEKPPEKTDPRILLYIRTYDEKRRNIGDKTHPPWYEFYRGSRPVIYGHWASQGLKIRQNTIGLDSGCVYGKSLSGILLPERQVFQVPARKNYSATGTQGGF